MIGRWYKKTPDKAEKATAAANETIRTELEDFTTASEVPLPAAVVPATPTPAPPAGKSNRLAGSVGNAPSAADTVAGTMPANQAKSLATVLGEIVWLMSQSAVHRQLFVSDLEWFAIAPVLLKQFRLFYAKDRAVGVAFWALVNDEVEERLKTGAAKLRPQDWKSGDKLWVVEVIAPFGGADRMLKDLKEKGFAGSEIR